MSAKTRSLCKLSLAVAIFCLLSTSAVVIHGQSASTPRAAWVDDWTHHRLVFSNPGSFLDAVKNGTVEHWYKITNEPRYQLQQLKRSVLQRQLAAAPDFAARTAIVSAASAAVVSPTAKLPKKQPIKKDWSVDLNGPSAIGTVTTNNASGSPLSSVTVNTTTLNASPPTAETATITFNSSHTYDNPANNSYVTIGSVTYTFDTSSITSAPSTGCLVYSVYDGTGATSLYQAITYTGTQGSTNYRCASSITAANSAVTASHTGGSSTIGLTAATPGSTGFTFTDGGTTHFTTFSSTAGTDGTQNGTTWTYWSGAAAVSADQVASNIASTINSNSPLDAQVIAVANGNQVIVTARTEGSDYAVGATNFSGFSWGTGVTNLGGGAAATVQPNTLPAKVGASLTGASCSDFVIYPTGMTGSTTAANIVAYNNLYVGGCTTGAVPSEYWAYNTGGAVTTSPAVSYDGTQVAFIQSNGTTASLVLLKWAATSGTLTAPGTPTDDSSSASTYRSCSGNCMFTLSLGANDTFSAPFIDYLNDALYVGDDTGRLHRITGVFNGTTIAEASGWPVTLNASNKVSSPTYDFTSGRVFVGDMGGILWSVPATTGTVYNTGKMGDAIADAPLVDGVVNSVTAFVTTSSVTGVFVGDNAVFEFSTGFVAYGTPGVEFAGVSSAGAGYFLYDGAFDNVYYSTSGTGNLYVVGNTGVTTGATLYQIGLSSGFFNGTDNAPVAGLSFTGTGATRPWPSPVTEFCNGACAASGGATTSGTDYIFFSVNRGAKTGCTTTAGNGCILAYSVNSPSTITQSNSGLNVVTPGTNGCWATGGLVIDNSATNLTGAQQIYFLNFNGIAAGGPVSGSKTGANCTAGAATAIIDATQASQANP